MYIAIKSMFLENISNLQFGGYRVLFRAHTPLYCNSIALPSQEFSTFLCWPKPSHWNLFFLLFCQILVNLFNSPPEFFNDILNRGGRGLLPFFLRNAHCCFIRFQNLTLKWKSWSFKFQIFKTLLLCLVLNALTGNS